MFEELDFQSTPIGDLSLRRRREPKLDNALAYEVKLGDEFLMSSLFTVGERELATRALAQHGGSDLAVVVGGLGLGYTAVAALECNNAASVGVVEALLPVIEWHRRGLLPLGPTLMSDPRCELVHGDFFALAAGTGFDPAQPGRQFDAILLDIDHAPDHRLDAGHDDFYSRAGIRGLRAHLREEGMFAMWSNDPPDTGFMDLLTQVFSAAHAEVVTFPNPYSGAESSCTLYFARR